jgi:hypothetical protein
MVLSAQELRHAITPGPAREFLERLAGLQEFKAATDYSVRSDRMGDRELVLRFIAFRLTSYRDYKTQEFDAFLLNAMNALNTLSLKRLAEIENNFKSAMSTAAQVFGRHAFRKRYRQGESRFPINKALFEAVAVNLAALDSAERSALLERKEVTNAGIMLLCNNREFESSISQGTGDVAKVRRRFEMVEQMLKDVLSHD